MIDRNKNRIHIIIVLLLGLTAFLIKFGYQILDYRFIGWLYGVSSDMLPDVSTWEYFRYSDFNWPPGVFNGYAWPQDVGIGNTNIIPWIAFPLHWIRDWLPTQFQYFGYFYLLCYLLQAYFADRLLLLSGVSNKVYRIVGIIFLLLSTSFLDRFSHIALNAHFFVLASFCVYLDKKSFIRKLLNIGLLSFFAAMTHPYLVLFPIAIGLSIFWKMKLRKQINWLQFLIGNLGNVASVLIAFLISGVFSLPSDGAQGGGFGIFSAPFDTFINGQEKAGLGILQFKTFYFGQYEGYAYLGFGVLLLWLILLSNKSFYDFSKRIFKSNYPLIIILLLLTAYAFAFQITISDKFRIAIPFKEHTLIYKLLSVFRSSGRYIWALHQWLIILPLIFLYKLKPIKQPLTYGLFSIALLLQFVDLAKMASNAHFSDYYKPLPEFEGLKKVITKSEGVIYTFPAYNRGLVHMDDEQFMISALAPYQIQITAGHLPRPNFRIQDSIKNLEEQMIIDQKWLINDKDILLMATDQVYNFQPLVINDSSLDIRQIGAYCILFKKGNMPISKEAIKFPQPNIKMVHITDFLTKNMEVGNYILITVKDEASSKLDSIFKKQFLNYQFSKLNFRDAYIGLFKGKIALKEAAGQLKLEMDTTINNHKIHLASNSGTNNNLEAIIIDEKSLSPNLRGLNIVILDSIMNVIDVKNFDTYRTLFTQEKTQ